MIGSVRFFSFVVLFLAPFSLMGREFTDTQGRKIEAEIVSYTGDSVDLKRGTKVFSIPVAKLSEDDQTFIKEWISQNLAKTGYRFRLYTSVEEHRSARKTVDGAVVQDKLKTRPHEYDIVVYNQSAAALSEVDIRYEIYVNDVVDTRGNRYVALAVGVKKQDRVQTIPGKLTNKTIDAEGKIEFKHLFDLHNYVDRDGGRVDQAANDSVIGVRVRIYKGEQLLKELTSSEDETRFGNTKWTDEEAKEETPEFTK